MSLPGLISLISQRCASRGCTLYDIADRYGWTAEQVNGLLRGDRKPTVRMLRELAKEIGVSAEYLREKMDA